MEKIEGTSKLLYLQFTEENKEILTYDDWKDKKLTDLRKVLKEELQTDLFYFALK